MRLRLGLTAPIEVDSQRAVRVVAAHRSSSRPPRRSGVAGVTRRCVVEGPGSDTLSSSGLEPAASLGPAVFGAVRCCCPPPPTFVGCCRREPRVLQREEIDRYRSRLGPMADAASTPAAAGAAGAPEVQIVVKFFAVRDLISTPRRRPPALVCFRPVQPCGTLETSAYLSSPGANSRTPTKSPLHFL
eukprot:SAG11_NODE_2978_length_2795_cov_4.170623_3_plen_187_part_00